MENRELAEKVVKYSAIYNLAACLETKEIPFHFKQLPEQGGFKILYPAENSVVCSIVEHDFSWGSEENLLEIYGLNEKGERNFDEAIGNLTVEEVLEIIEKDYNNYKPKLVEMENIEIKELSQTCEMMYSKDYRERFKAEFFQLKIRTEKLENFLAKIKAKYHYENICLANDKIQHDCDEDLIEEQLIHMKEYLFILKQRAVIENIDIL